MELKCVDCGRSFNGKYAQRCRECGLKKAKTYNKVTGVYKDVGIKRSTSINAKRRKGKCDKCGEDFIIKYSKTCLKCREKESSRRNNESTKSPYKELKMSARKISMGRG